MTAPQVDSDTDLYFVANLVTLGLPDSFPPYFVKSVTYTLNVFGATAAVTATTGKGGSAKLGPILIKSGQMGTITGNAKINEQVNVFGYYNMAPLVTILRATPP